MVAFLKSESPDYLCLQELKCSDEKYPDDIISASGYHSIVYGQKAYNGVAVLSKKPTSIIAKNFGNGTEDDPAARLLTVKAEGFTLLSAYVPNGQSVGSEKFVYKQKWLINIRDFFGKNFKPSDPLVLVGDFNIAPTDLDVYDPVGWRDHIHCTEHERQWLKNLLSFGLIDLQRMKDSVNQCFTWWDYRAGSFDRDKGLRIDMIYATMPMAKRCKEIYVVRSERGKERPSDHAPVVAVFES